MRWRHRGARGLLGFEAANSLHRLGLTVTVGERSDRVLRRNIDERASAILTGFLIRVGIDVRHGIEIAVADGRPPLTSITTTSGEEIAADVLLVAAGITPSVASRWSSPHRCQP